MNNDSGIEVVRAWMRGAGECPSEGEFYIAFCLMLNEWRDNRKSGMDVLASAVLDEMEETVKAMRDV